ncbi:DCC1-like thiol-disulfide oxidoreductase family protein [Salinibacterium sp. ZJ454]|uniref:thiol-disulfide oxidoreductase DCC family protein n=1 Tax=Salinibacterium sp. ZJ454 TaxID=2708339 RepID=UPI0032650AB9
MFAMSSTGAQLLITTKETRLVFDGDCAFCTLWVNRLQEILPIFPDAVPWQWTDLEALALTADDVERFAWVVTPAHQYAGHLAFSALLRMQPRWWLRLLGWLIATPPYSWVAASGYAFIAKNRHRLPGGTPACQMPVAR